MPLLQAVKIVVFTLINLRLRDIFHMTRSRSQKMSPSFFFNPNVEGGDGGGGGKQRRGLKK